MLHNEYFLDNFTIDLSTFNVFFCMMTICIMTYSFPKCWSFWNSIVSLVQLCSQTLCGAQHSSEHDRHQNTKQIIQSVRNNEGGVNKSYLALKKKKGMLSLCF